LSILDHTDDNWCRQTLHWDGCGRLAEQVRCLRIEGVIGIENGYNIGSRMLNQFSERTALAQIYIVYDQLYAVTQEGLNDRQRVICTFVIGDQTVPRLTTLRMERLDTVFDIAAIIIISHKIGYFWLHSRLLFYTLCKAKIEVLATLATGAKFQGTSAA
jgi:hypothetical protein